MRPVAAHVFPWALRRGWPRNLASFVHRGARAGTLVVLPRCHRGPAATSRESSTKVRKQCYRQAGVGTNSPQRPTLGACRDGARSTLGPALDAQGDNGQKRGKGVQLVRKHINYASVTATLALIFSMSGAAIAAKHYLINSTSQINPKVLKKLAGKPGPAGKAGPLGKEGPQGKEGAVGKEGSVGKEGKEGKEGSAGPTNVTVREGELKSVPAGAVGVVTASCNPGEKATGWGSSISGSDSEWTISESFPVPPTGTPTGWQVRAVNHGAGANNLVAFVICAS